MYLYVRKEAPSFEIISFPKIAIPNLLFAIFRQACMSYRASDSNLIFFHRLPLCPTKRTFRKYVQTKSTFCY